MLIIVLSSTAFSQVVKDSDPELKGIDVIEHLGKKIPLDLYFTNDSGQRVQLGQYFNHGKPVIMVLAYYTCPMLCTLVLNNIAQDITHLPFTPGKEYQILTLSIDPRDTPDIASAKKKNLLNSINKPEYADGWTLFTSEESQIKPLAESLGFQYYFDSKTSQYAHPTVIFILMPDGEISRYLYGVDFNPRDLRVALLEAADGKIGTTIDRIILYCYHYDPLAKGYVLFATNIMKLGGLITLIIFGIILGFYWRAEKRKKLIKTTDMK